MITSIIRIVLGTALLFLSAVFANAYSNEELLSSVNSIRKENSLSELVLDTKLNEAASLKLADIQTYKYWAHNNPETGKKWINFIRDTGYRFDTGENLARGFDDINKIINAWLESPSHRKNLLSSKFDNYGLTIGQVNYVSGPQTVVVLIFGDNESQISKLLHFI